VHDLLGELYTRRGKHADAVREYEQVISISESKYGSKDPNLVPSLKLLKTAYLKSNNAAKARQIDKRIASISKPNTVKKTSHGH
jgi:hypothetical protein